MTKRGHGGRRTKKIVRGPAIRFAKLQKRRRKLMSEASRQEAQALKKFQAK